MDLRVFAGPRRLVVLVATVAAICAAALAYPVGAGAGVVRFCPAGSGYKLVAANGRCVSAGFHTLRQVAFSLKNGPGVYHCAGAKTNSDGSGHNAIPFTCGTSQSVYSVCAKPYDYPNFYDPQYATGLNQSNSAHYYYGAAAYGYDNSNCVWS